MPQQAASRPPRSCFSFLLSFYMLLATPECLVGFALEGAGSTLPWGERQAEQPEGWDGEVVMGGGGREGPDLIYLPQPRD